MKYTEDRKTDQYGNIFRYRGTANPDDPDGSHVDRKVYDVIFVSPITGGTKNILSPAEGKKCAVPTPTKAGMLSTTSSLR